jgi:acyl-CoA thioesterase YciA
MNSVTERNISESLPLDEEPVIRTVPQPADVNSNGDVFGGWIMSQMDIAGGIVANRRAGQRVATVSVDSMSFLRPVYVGDVVSIFGAVEKVGRTSIAVRLETYVRRHDAAEQLKVTEGTYVFVAIDRSGRPIPVGENNADG